MDSPNTMLGCSVPCDNTVPWDSCFIWPEVCDPCPACKDQSCIFETNSGAGTETIDCWIPNRVCHVNCFSCHNSSSNANKCTRCLDVNASIAGNAAYGEWVCNDGYYNTYAAPLVSWAACATGCGTCTGGTLSDCQSCVSPYFLEALIGADTVKNVCATTCADRYYGDSGTNECTVWHNECATCSGPLHTECLTCYLSDATPATVPGECFCNDNFFDTDNDIEEIDWVECNSAWEICTSTAATDC